jgi:hypothetical protein
LNLWRRGCPTWFGTACKVITRLSVLMPIDAEGYIVLYRVVQSMQVWDAVAMAAPALQPTVSLVQNELPIPTHPGTGNNLIDQGGAFISAIRLKGPWTGMAVTDSFQLLWCRHHPNCRSQSSEPTSQSPVFSFVRQLSMAAPSIPNLLSLRGTSRGGGRGRRPGASSRQGTTVSPDAAIQGTDTDAAVSRLSAVDLGYLQDPYAKLFVTGPPTRRLPIINRGPSR